MAEIKTPYGLVVGMIPDQPAPDEIHEEPVEKPKRGRKPKED